MLDNVNEAWPTDPKLASARTLAKTTRLPGSPGPYTSIVGAAQNKFIIIDMFAKVAQGSSPKDAIAFAVNEYNTPLARTWTMVLVRQSPARRPAPRGRWRRVRPVSTSREGDGYLADGRTGWRARHPESLAAVVGAR